MHKDDASLLFAVLGDASRVKIVKMLYNRSAMSEEQLQEKIDGECLKDHLEILLNSQLIFKNDHFLYECNKSLVDELMHFITTPCKCCK